MHVAAEITASSVVVYFFAADVACRYRKRTYCSTTTVQHEQTPPSSVCVQHESIPVDTVRTPI